MRPAVRGTARLLRPAAVAARATQRGSRFAVVGWHRFDGQADGLSTPIDVFCRQLDALERWGAAVLSLDAATRLSARNAMPDRAVVLTFDDGYASAVEKAWPLLRERSLPATLFVVTGYLDGTKRFPWDAAEYANDRTRLAVADQVVAAAAEGLDIGSHTVTHRWLPRLSAVEVERELVDSRATVEELLGRPVPSMAYPMGGWNPTTRTAAARAGYTIAITVDRGLNAPTQDPLALKRSVAPNSVVDFQLMLDGAYTWLRALDTFRSRKGPRW